MIGSEKGRSGDWPKPEDLISLHQAAKLSGLSTSHLRRLASQREIWGTKVGRDWLTTEQAVREYMARDHRPGPKPLKQRPNRK